MAILVLCLKPQNLLDPNPAFVSFGNRLTISPVVERLVFSKVVLRWPQVFCCGVWQWYLAEQCKTKAAAPLQLHPCCDCGHAWPPERLALETDAEDWLCACRCRRRWRTGLRTWPAPGTSSASSPATWRRPSRPRPTTSGAAPHPASHAARSTPTACHQNLNLQHSLPAQHPRAKDAACCCASCHNPNCGAGKPSSLPTRQRAG